MSKIAEHLVAKHGARADVASVMNEATMQVVHRQLYPTCVSRFGPTHQHFSIHISSTHPDADAIVREATTKIACEVGWGDDYLASIEAVRHHPDGAEHLASYEMEPGDNEKEII